MDNQAIENDQSIEQVKDHWFSGITEQEDSRKSIMIAIPTKHIVGNVNGRLVDFIRAAERSHQYKVDCFRMEQSPIDIARNQIVDTFMPSKFDYLMMVDDDVIPPVRALKMVEHNKDVIIGLCYVYQNRRIVPNVFRQPFENIVGYDPLVGIENTGLVEVAAGGTGCILISRKVFETVEKPYFEYQMDEFGKKQLGEDLSFCRKVKKAGFKVYCDTNVICGHLKILDLAELAPFFRTKK